MWEVKKSKVHGSGIFASENIAKGTKIIEYIGEKISKTEGDRRSEKRIKKYLHSKVSGSVYIFELNKKFDIDGSPKYNKARYINHSCDPNCEVTGTGLKVWVHAIKDIKKNEEFSYDYGFSFDEDYKSYPCRCRSKNCCGYIIREGSRWRIKKKNTNKK